MNAKLLAGILFCLSMLCQAKDAIKINPTPTHKNLEIIDDIDAPENIAQSLEIDNVLFVLFSFVDLFGSQKEVLIPLNQAKKAFTSGLTFDSSSLEGYGKIFESDMIIKPDLSTMRMLPWADESHKTAWFMCTVYKNTQEPFEADSRHRLQELTSELETRGYDFHVGVELEFFIFKRNQQDEPTLQPCDTSTYFASETSFSRQQQNHLILHALKGVGVNAEKLHHEVAPGQHEITIKYGNAIEIADQVIAAKYALRVLYEQLGYHISFMPKPIFGQNGSGMHIHYSLFNPKTKQNAFYEATDAMGLSPIARQFIAGNLTYMHEFCALLNPTVNSFKRLVPGYEAPIYRCWGQLNRSSMFRIPLMHEAATVAMRAEIRSPDPSCNPYLAIGALLMTGLAGIKENLTLSDPINVNLFTVPEKDLAHYCAGSWPTSLKEAIDNLKSSLLAKDFLTQKGVDEFVKVKTKEWENFCKTVTDWEIKKYL